MSTFYNFISLAIVDKLNPSVLKKRKSLDQVKAGQSFIVFPNLIYLYAKNIDVNFVYSVESYDSSPLLIRDVVFETIIEILDEVINGDNFKDDSWLKSSIKNRHIANNEEFLLYGTVECKHMINILKKYYPQYKERIVLDCLNNKLTSRGKHSHIVINEMMELYTELMKVFNSGYKSNGVVYIRIG